MSLLLVIVGCVVCVQVYSRVAPFLFHVSVCTPNHGICKDYLVVDRGPYRLQRLVGELCRWLYGVTSADSHVVASHMVIGWGPFDPPFHQLAIAILRFLFLFR